MLTDEHRQALAEVAQRFKTPCYAYFADVVTQRIRQVRETFAGQFLVSFAVKANPNPELLKVIAAEADLLDISSGGELERALEVGCAADRLTFSGPAKRVPELELAVQRKCGHVVCESPWELDQLNALCGQHGTSLEVLIRICPQKVPKGFSVGMSGKASQFGIDEEDLPAVLEKRQRWANLKLVGFHVYAGTNSLSVDGLTQNFEINCALFERFVREFDVDCRWLVFGAGFGIPYEMGIEPLDLPALAARTLPRIEELRGQPRLADTRLVLETGRYLIGPAGYFVTSVINTKRSRGVDIMMCDGGMNAHLGACGLMGQLIRRNWPMWKVNTTGKEEVREYWLVGPLCTTIDTLGYKVNLPQLDRGDVVAIGSSGAYGLTSSPTRFISHPEPSEVLIRAGDQGFEFQDISQR